MPFYKKAPHGYSRQFCNAASLQLPVYFVKGVQVLVTNHHYPLILLHSNHNMLFLLQVIEDQVEWMNQIGTSGSSWCSKEWDGAGLAFQMWRLCGKEWQLCNNKSNILEAVGTYQIDSFSIRSISFTYVEFSRLTELGEVLHFFKQCAVTWNLFNLIVEFHPSTIIEVIAEHIKCMRYTLFIQYATYPNLKLHLLEYNQWVLHYMEYYISRIKEVSLFRSVLYPFSVPDDVSGYNNSIITNNVVAEVYTSFCEWTRTEESIAYLRILTGKFYTSWRLWQTLIDLHA